MVYSGGKKIPEEERYDGYIQLENGVGMMRLLYSEVQDEMERILQMEEYPVWREKIKRTLTIATGKLAYPTIRKFAEMMMEVFPGLHIHVFAIRNDFFGETVTVSGLITGQDLECQLKERQENGTDLGDTLLITCNMLRSGEEVFLDDMTVQQLEEALHLQLVAVENEGKELIRAVLSPEYKMNRTNDEDRFVYVQGYEKEDM